MYRQKNCNILLIIILLIFKYLLFMLIGKSIQEYKYFNIYIVFFLHQQPRWIIIFPFFTKACFHKGMEISKLFKQFLFLDSSLRNIGKILVLLMLLGNEVRFVWIIKLHILFVIFLFFISKLTTENWNYHCLKIGILYFYMNYVFFDFM